MLLFPGPKWLGNDPGECLQFIVKFSFCLSPIYITKKESTRLKSRKNYITKKLQIAFTESQSESWLHNFKKKPGPWRPVGLN